MIEINLNKKLNFENKYSNLIKNLYIYKKRAKKNNSISKFTKN
jgi:hypothetical protein